MQRKLALTAPLIALFANASALAENVGFEQLVARHAEAVVAVRYVMKSPTSDQQRDVETVGLVIDAKGLVLCANTRLGGNPLGGQSLTPTDIKVIIGDDPDGLEAKIIGRDTERDLGWLQITAKLEAPLKFIDTTKAATLGVGDTVYSLRQLDKYFGRAIVAQRGNVAGLLTKPRDLIVPTAGIGEEPGLPCFGASGEFAGMVVIQVPDAEAQRSSGRQLSSRDVLFILPAEQVRKATELAKMQAEDEEEDEAEGEPTAEQEGGE